MTIVPSQTHSELNRWLNGVSATPGRTGLIENNLHTSAGTTMDSIIQWLSEQCSGHLLTEKWLVAEELRIAQQWKDRVNLRGCSTINLHSKTLPTIVVSLVANILAEEELTFAGQSTARMLIRSELGQQLESGKLKYFHDVQSIDGLSDLLSRSIRDLQLANLDPWSIEAGDFESTAKAADIRLIYESYLQLLQRQQTVDYSACIRLAISGLKDGAIALPGELLILMPERPRLSLLEQQMVGVLTARARLQYSDHLDPYVVAPERIPNLVSANSDSVSYFAGLGEVNEIRGVFQRILSTKNDGDHHLDDVEILHTEYQQYVPLILELLTSWLSEVDDDRLASHDLDRLPVTFAEGIACIYSRPGRALRGWVRWARHDFVQTKIVQLIREGLLVRPEAGQSIGYSRLASSLREIPIGFKADRYMPKIQQAVQAAEQSWKEYQKKGDPESGETASEKPHRDFGLPSLQTIASMVEPVIDLAPHPEDEAATILAKAKKFLLRCARADSKLDRYARGKLLDDIDSMLTGLKLGDIDLDVFSWLEELPIESRILASGPLPGRVHVAALSRGGQTGRKHVYIVGLDDGRYPRRIPVDPIVLDSERTNVSPNLANSNELTEDTKRAIDRALYRILAAGGAQVCLSYSNRSLQNDRSCFPSSAMLELFRMTEQNENAHMDDLLTQIGPPAAFVGTDPDGHLALTDEHLATLLGEPSHDKRNHWLHENVEHSRHQSVAAGAHASANFGEFDGHVPTAGIDLDPTAAGMVSSSRLETFGTCPRRFFFRYGLGIRPPDEWTVDRERWLDPLQFGNLVHGLFEQFLGKLTEGGATPDAQTDRQPLLDALHARIEDLTADIPIPNEDAYRRTCDLLEDICEIFLEQEEAYCRAHNARPWVLEASLGLGAEPKTELDCLEPIPLTLSDGRLIRVGGRLDRVDKLNAHGSERYAIWDYKSGSSYGFNQQDPFKQGRKLQPYLYLGMLRHRISATGGGADAVESFGYFFPSPRTEGLRLQWTRAELRGGDEVLRQICDLISSGVFLPTTDPGDCTYCDYLPVCGDAEVVAGESVRKSVHEDNGLLEPWRKLREIEPGGDVSS